MEIQIKEKAHVILSYNRSLIDALANAEQVKDNHYDTEFKGSLIGSFEKINRDTDKIYYKGVSLKVPKHRDVEEVAERIAETTDPEVLENLELKVVQIFTTDINEALEFTKKEADETATKLSSNYLMRFVTEALEKEYVPF